MNRREAIRQLGVGAALPVIGDLTFAELLEVGRGVRSGLGRPETAVLLALTERQAMTVASLAEIIIPRTDTPGATDVGVTTFIDRIVAEWYTDEERGRFEAGLAALDARARQLFGVEFLQAGSAEQEILASELDQELQAAIQRDRERPSGQGSRARDLFFYQMKRLTLTGYFTSEVAMTEVLGYRIVPGAYQPCIPLDP